MTDTKELDDLIGKARALGATVTVTYDEDAMRDEGRRIHQTIQVSGLAGIGPLPMWPLSAAEKLRIAIHQARYLLVHIAAGEECQCSNGSCREDLREDDPAYIRKDEDPQKYTYCSPECGKADEFVIKNPRGDAGRAEWR